MVGGMRQIELAHLLRRNDGILLRELMRTDETDQRSG